MCSYGSAVKWHPKWHGSATEHHHIYSAGNNLHWSCLLRPAFHVKHRFLKRNGPVLSCNFGHFNAESWRPFRADLLGELQVLAPQQRLVIFSPGGCHLIKVCLPFYSLFLIFITLFFSWSAAVVSGWWGVKVILTVYPLPPHLYWENTVPILCQCRLQCHPAGASQQPVWPQTRLWLRAAWRCPFPPLYRLFFSWCCHVLPLTVIHRGQRWEMPSGIISAECTTPSGNWSHGHTSVSLCSILFWQEVSFGFQIHSMIS